MHTSLKIPGLHILKYSSESIINLIVIFKKTAIKSKLSMLRNTHRKSFQATNLIAVDIILNKLEKLTKFYEINQNKLNFFKSKL